MKLALALALLALAVYALRPRKPAPTWDDAFDEAFGDVSYWPAVVIR